MSDNKQETTGKYHVLALVGAGDTALREAFNQKADDYGIAAAVPGPNDLKVMEGGQEAEVSIRVARFYSDEGALAAFDNANAAVLFQDGLASVLRKAATADQTVETCMTGYACQQNGTRVVNMRVTQNGPAASEP